MLPTPDSLPDSLAAQYRDVRCLSEKLCEPLTIEDYVIQSMPDASPAKWHLAHTSWFFETFVLKSADPNYQSLHPQYDFLFNSYYNAVGVRHCRPKRGLISRPTVSDTYQYRAYVDAQMQAFLAQMTPEQQEMLGPIVVLGLHHEQQHQELLVTDIKHAFSENPLHPIYRPASAPERHAPSLTWITFPEGIYEIGHTGDEFAFDNEGPRHREWLNGFQLGSRLVTNGEYLAFMEDGGYQKPLGWLSAGWNTVQAEHWEAPMYWERQEDSSWAMITLAGMRPVVMDEPVCHLSYFEADAYAQWAGARLPTEAEWEVAAETVPTEGNFVESGFFHPATADPDATGLTQMFGDVWQWTRSAYLGYPGYAPVAGALGEYNGKFMSGQFVLRGGSCATSRTHIRRTYRNFFAPDSRWQFMGLRLAKDQP